MSLWEAHTRDLRHSWETERHLALHGSTERKLHHLLMNMELLAVGSNTVHMEALARDWSSRCMGVLRLTIVARLCAGLTLHLPVLPRLLLRLLPWLMLRLLPCLLSIRITSGLPSRLSWSLTLLSTKTLHAHSCSHLLIPCNNLRERRLMWVKLRAKHRHRSSLRRHTLR